MIILPVLTVLAVPFAFLGIVIIDNNKTAVNIARDEEEWLQ